jgi:subtilisin family serine protease
VKRFFVAALAVALLVPAAGAAAFTVTDPLVSKQWYLGAIRAFDLWPTQPVLEPVKVAIVDSGIDVGHPEFAGRIADARSFVGGDVLDREGHGTFVAGIIAAGIDNNVGIAGIAFPAQLLVAKVVRPDGTISPDAEARGIRWAVDAGARVINLSLGGVRDPRDVSRDTFSRLEADAVAYAYSKGAVVVAAVGNSDQAPAMPWDYASYPAALPHVIGVGALAQDGSIPLFSNRDSVYEDLVAPGEAIVSTIPRAMTASRPTCPDQGYSVCGPAEFRNAEGTSYAAAQVSAAAALVLATRPDLAPDQVAAVLERSAVDVSAVNGCRECPLQRDALSGWGRLDVTAALQALDGPLPSPDRYETNDDAGSYAHTMYGSKLDISATLDFWDDQIDVYRLKLLRGQTLAASLRGPPATDTNLVLWKPGTASVEGLSPDVQSRRATQSAAAGPNEHFTFRAPVTGWYYVEVKLATPGAGPYTLRIRKSP